METNFFNADKIHILSDIDGTIFENVWSDEELIADKKRLDKVLSEILAFEWVFETFLFRNADSITFITGRQERQHDLTIKSIENNAGIYNFELLHTPYSGSYEKYVNDKKEKFLELIKSNMKNAYNISKYIIIEDDKSILKETKIAGKELEEKYKGHLKIEYYQVDNGTVSVF